MPGEQLAQNILDANLLSVLQLVIVLFVLAIVLLVAAILAMMYYNSQAVSKMSATQQSMSIANTQMVAADGEKTKVMQASVDELKLFRQDFGASTIAMQRMAEQTGHAIETHEAKSDDRVKTIIDHVSTESKLMRDAMTSAMTDLVGEAVGTIKGNTIEAVAPALAVIDELRQLSDTISARQDNAVDLLREQQMAQINALREQNDMHIRVINTRLAQAQQEIIQVFQRAEQESKREQDAVGVVGGPAGGNVSAGNASGSAGDNGTGKPDGGNGTTGESGA